MTEQARVLFVNPPPLPDMTSNHEATSGMGGLMPGTRGFAYPPHTLATCLSHARAAGFEAAFADGSGAHPAVLAREIAAAEADVVAILVSVGTAEADLNFLRLLKQARGCRAPARVLLLGPSAHRAAGGWVEEGLAHAVLLGEPELAVTEAIGGVLAGRRGDFPAAQLAPAAYSAANLLRDLDATLFPAWDAAPWQPYGMVTLLSSRGCAAGCRFCAYTLTQGTGWRAQSVERTLAEWFWIARDVRPPRLVFRDTVFAQERGRVAALCEALLARESGVPGQVLAWECESRPEHFDRDLLALMKRAGCATVKIGMESGDAAFLARLGRVASSSTAEAYLGQVRRVAEWCAELDIRCRVFVLAGLPHQPPASIEATRSALRLLPASTIIHANAYRPYEGVDVGGPSQPVSAAMLEGLRTANRPEPPLFRQALGRLKRKIMPRPDERSGTSPSSLDPRGPAFVSPATAPYLLAGSRVFLTGGNGFVGGYVARALAQAGALVVALVRPGSRPGMLAQVPGIQIVRGDLVDPSTWSNALAGCRACFHVAALYAPAEQAAAMTATNVRGTSALLAACVAAGIGRFIHTSTIGTAGRPPADSDGTLPDETTPFNLWDQASHYVRSKYVGELVARSWGGAGIDVIVVKPTAPVGAGDARPTATGRRILAALQAKPLPYPAGGINYAPVTDIAAGHVLAAERGRTGETYILGHCKGNLDEVAFLHLVTGQVSAGKPASHGAGLLAGLTANPEKAVRELGMPQSDLGAAFAESVAWYRAHVLDVDTREGKAADVPA